MRGALSDLKAAPAVWAGVWLSLIVSQTAVCTIVAARRAIDAAYHGPDAGLGANLSGPAMLFSVVIAVFVMLWVVTAALNQRRHQLALLVLQGATPWQLLFGNLAIIIVLFILAAVASSLLTPLAAPYLFDLLARAFELKLTYQATQLLASIGTGLAIAGVAVLAGTVLTVRTLSKIRPIEALRQSQNPPRQVNAFRVLLGTSLLVGAICVLIIPGTVTRKIDPGELATHISGRNPIESRVTGFIGFSMGGMFLLIFALAVLAPYVMHWFTKGWTHLLPLPFSTWKLARQQAVGRIQRQNATIIPMTAGLSLLMTFSGVLHTLTDSLKNFASNGHSMNVNPHMLTNLMAMLGPALIIALVGAISGLMITARGRRLDLALTYVSGASTGQLRILGALDGLISMVTSVLLAFVITLLSTCGTAFMLQRYLGSAKISVQWGYWAVIALLAIVVGALVTGVQALCARSEDSVRVISRAVGE